MTSENNISHRGMRWRQIVRMLMVMIAIVVLLPLVVPLPPIGVEAKTLADADGTFIDVDGLSTYVLARGPENGEPIILLHGWGASTFTWRLNMDTLVEAGYRVIAFDRPPYGLSAKTGANIPYSPIELADFTAKVMDVLGISKAVLVGQSQGGGVAGYFAVKYPERVTKLVLVSAALHPSDDPSDEAGTSNRVGGTLGISPFVSSLLSLPPVEWWTRVALRVFVKPDFSTQILKSAYYAPNFMTPEMADGYARQLKVIGWDEALVKQISGGAFRSDSITRGEIASITVPVMIVWGENDTWVPLSVGERLHELLPNATWKIYAKAGHLVQEEAAESFNTDLIAFLN